MKISLLSSICLLSALTLVGCVSGKGGSDDTGGPLDKDGDGFDEADDCDDSNALVNPDQAEQCDGVDNNCDGTVDDESATDAAAWYPDGDNDGYGDDAASVMACAAPDGYLASGGDCDDLVAEINPVASEVCDGEDNDCDGNTDDESAIDALTWFPDGDGDGHGANGEPVTACEAPVGYAAGQDDCDDADDTAFPGNDELCDNVDNDCDFETDENAIDASTWYPDGDSDGFADEAAGGALVQCEQPDPTYVTDVGDCDDADPAINPTAVEICDGVDNDCDPGTPEAGTATWTDADGALSNVTGALTGTASAPAELTLSTVGTLRICEGTWYAKVIAEADASILGMGSDASSVVLDGGGVTNLLSVLSAGTEVDVSRLTLQNGAGEADGTDTVGGAAACMVDSASTLPSLDLSDVVLADNAATYGGALYALNCDLSIDEADITGNSADTGGAIVSSAGALSISDSTVMLNQATNLVGGILVMDATVPATLTDTLVSENAAASNYGGLYLEQADLTCTSTTGVAAGFTSNSAGLGDAGGVHVGQGSTFTSAGCDFGSVTGGDENGLYDVVVGDTDFSYWYGDDQSFLCTDALCGTEVSYTVGTAGTTVAAASIGRGNVYLADQDGTIDSFAVSLKANLATGCTVDFYVLSAASTADATWDVDWSGSQSMTSTSTTFLDSGDIGLPVEIGRYYALAFGWDCSGGVKLTYGYEGTAVTGDTAGIGTVVARWVDSGYASGDYTTTVATAYDSGIYNFYTKVDVSH
jgi:hypothetical protein